MIRSFYFIFFSFRKSCSNTTERNKGGRKPIKDTQLAFDLNKHMENMSTIAANRFLIKEKANAFNRHDTLRLCYESFPQKHLLSYSAFVNNMAKKFKKPHRLSDMCETCEQGKFLFRNLISATDKIDIKQMNIDSVDSNLEELKRFLKYLKVSEQTEVIHDCNPALEIIPLIQEVQFHRNIAKMQRKSYNEMRSNEHLLKDSILIDLDFKQKIIIGDSPVMVSGEYFQRQQRSLLGFGVYYYDNKINSVRCKHFDFVSEVDCKQHASKAIHGFRYLREQIPFKEIEKSNYIIWADCGPHFRCSEFVYFLFDELSKKEKLHINLNFFAERHGKNSRDQHFSVISSYVRLESFKEKITSSQHLVDTINKRQSESNKLRKSAKMDEIESYAYVLRSITEQDELNYLRRVDSLKLYYNISAYIKNEQIFLKSKIFSKTFVPSGQYIDIESKLIKKAINQRKLKTLPNKNIVQISTLNTIEHENSTATTSKNALYEESSEEEDTTKDKSAFISETEIKLNTCRNIQLDKMILKRSKIEAFNNGTSSTPRTSKDKPSFQFQFNSETSRCNLGKNLLVFTLVFLTRLFLFILFIINVF